MPTKLVYRLNLKRVLESGWAGQKLLCWSGAGLQLHRLLSLDLRSQLSSKEKATTSNNQTTWSWSSYGSLRGSRSAFRRLIFDENQQHKNVADVKVLLKENAVKRFPAGQEGPAHTSVISQQLKRFHQPCQNSCFRLTRQPQRNTLHLTPVSHSSTFTTFNSRKEFSRVFLT